jgi:ABC-type multidrug transport system ATPase subunit
VVLNAIMMGLTPNEAKARFEPVIEFAELEEFSDLKLKNYSSGMHVRLAFSVMIQVDAEVLLIDEVLAVGDAAFQKKCYDEFDRMREEGRTIVLVTHDMAAVNRFCHRAMVLERGQVVTMGDPAEVSTRYVDLNFNRQDGTARDQDADAPHPPAEIVNGWFEDEHGNRTGALDQGQPCRFKARIHFRELLDDPVFTLVLENEEGRALFATSTMWTEERTGLFEPGDKAVLSVNFENPFMPGRYYATAWVARPEAPTSWIHRRARIASVLITGPFHSGGQVDLPHDVAVEHVKAKEPSEASA